MKILLDLLLLSIKEKRSTEFLFLFKNMSTTAAMLIQKTNWFLVAEILDGCDCSSIATEKNNQLD